MNMLADRVESVPSTDRELEDSDQRRVRLKDM